MTDLAPGIPAQRSAPPSWVGLPLVRVMLIGSALVMTLHVGALLTRLAIRPEPGPLAEFLKIINAAQERSLAAWWTSGMLLAASAAAFLAGALAARVPGAPRRLALAWRTLAVVLALLSFDEIVSIHERGRHITKALIDGHSLVAKLGWMIPASVVLLVAVLVLVPLCWVLPWRSRATIALGFATSVGGAMGMEFAHVLLVRHGAEWRWRFLAVILEESLEMLGVIVVLAGILLAVGVQRGEGRITLRYESG